MMNAYPVDCREAVQIPEGIALSPVEETIQSYEDVLSLFSAEIDSGKTPTSLQSPSAMFSAGKSKYFLYGYYFLPTHTSSGLCYLGNLNTHYSNLTAKYD